VAESEPQSGRDIPGAEVLTLPEVAAYLRVPQEAILELIADGTIPAQKIGGEWRFLKGAVVEWLRLGPYFRDFRMFPPLWTPDHPFWQELSRVLEKRILSEIPSSESPSDKRGSKQAVLRHFGVFQDDADLEDQLAGIRARRKAARE
jgi:excisionase family DNA binding protein